MIMSLDMLSGLLSQRSGIEQSVAGSVINAVIGHITQQGSISNLFNRGSNYTDHYRNCGIQSVLSNLIGQRDSGQLNQDHSLIQHVQQKTGIQDQEKAREYTHHALGVLNEHANSNPNGLQSLFNNLLGL